MKSPHEFKVLLQEIGADALGGFKVTPEERAEVLDLMQEYGTAIIRSRTAQDDVDREAALRDAEGYADALSLKTAQFRLRTGHAAEQALQVVFKRIAKLVILALA